MENAKEDLGNAQVMQEVAGDGYTTGDQSQLIDGGTNGERTNSEISPLHMEEQSQKVTSEGLKVIIISSITFAVSVTVALVLTIYLAPPPVSSHAGVAAEDEVCSDIGLDVLKKSGSAVDSAIASVFCVGVVSPHHTGLGGGGFMIIRLHKENETVVIDFRETAPNSSTPDMFKNNPEARLSGGMSVAVPGELRGLEAAHKKFGKLSWKELVQPAADLARNGFNVSQSLADHIKDYIDPVNDPQPLVKIFYRDNKPLGVGDLLKRPDLADVLDQVAERGAEAVYSGEYAQEIVNTVNKNGGHITLQDLKDYASVQREPIHTILGEYVVETVSTPTGGPQLLLILNIMQGYQQNRTDPLYYHRLVEAIKMAYGQGDQLADPAFQPIAEVIANRLANKTFADEMRSMIHDNMTHSDSAYYMTSGGVPTSAGTSHVSVIGPHEDLVSVTSTINQPFGSKLVTKNGIILNNEMGDFSTATSSSPADNLNNLPAPGKRPLSHTTPVVIHKINKNCGERMAIGGINGTRIISGVAEVILDHFLFANGLNYSIERPRIHCLLEPDTIEYENGIGQDVLDYLTGVGHTRFEELEAINIVNAVLKINESVYAHSDSRVGGKAAYY